jgi:hypothetical protein
VCVCVDGLLLSCGWVVRCLRCSFWFWCRVCLSDCTFLFVTGGCTACCETYHTRSEPAFCILRLGSRCVEDGSGYHFHGPDLWVLHTYERQGNRTHGSGYRGKLVATRLETDSRQGVTARPGARFGPSGIRRGSRRIAPEAAWSIYTGMYSSVCSVLPVRVASIATRVQPVITLHAIRSHMHGHSAASVAQSGLREAVSHAYVEYEIRTRRNHTKMLEVPNKFILR